MAIKKQSTTPKREETKVRTSQKDYDCVYSFREMPPSEAYREKLYHSLMEWADTDQKAFKLNIWLRKQGIARRTWYDWIDRYEKLKFAHKWALNCIGDNREEKMLEGQYPEKSVMFSMPKYDEDWDELYKNHAKLKEATEQKATVYHIHENPYPEPKEEK